MKADQENELDPEFWEEIRCRVKSIEDGTAVGVDVFEVLEKM